MYTLQPSEALALLKFNLPALETEHGITRKILAAIPEENVEYRPAPVAKSAWELATHIAGVENMFLSGVGTSGFDFALSAAPSQLKNLSEVVRWYDEEFQKNYQRLLEADAESLVQTVDFRGKWIMPSVWFLWRAIGHSIHHRGQLSVYLRPMGTKVPSIYGESFDDAQARKAAQSAS